MKSSQQMPGLSTCPRLARTVSTNAGAPPVIAPLAGTANEAAELWRCLAFNSIGPRSISPWYVLSIARKIAPNGGDFADVRERLAAVEAQLQYALPPRTDHTPELTP